MLWDEGIKWEQIRESKPHKSPGLGLRMAAWCWAAAPIRDFWFWLRRSVTLTVCVGLHQFFPLRALAFVRFLRAAFFRRGAGLSPCRRTCALLVSSAVSSSAPCSVVCRFFRLPGVGPCWFCFASCLVLQARRGFSASPSLFGARLWLVRHMRSCGLTTDSPARPSRLIRPHPSCLACATTCVAAPALPHLRCHMRAASCGSNFLAVSTTGTGFPSALKA